MPDFKITLLMAMSVNGMIADLEDGVPWTEPIWTNYNEFVRSKGALIVGRRTYDIMVAENEIAKLGNVHLVVLTKLPKPPMGKAVFVSTPQEAIQSCKDKGFGETVLGGGTETNAAFLADKLVSDVVLDIDPILMAQGKSLLKDVPFSNRLKLKEIKNLGGDCVRLHYQF